MLERDVRRRYNRELGGSIFLYALVLIASVYAAKRTDVGAIRAAVLLAPLVPVALVTWAIARQFRRMDEFVRLRSLESVAVSAAVTAGWTFAYGFLESAGFPRVSMFWVWPVMGATWGLHACLRSWFSR